MVTDSTLTLLGVNPVWMVEIADRQYRWMLKSFFKKVPFAAVPGTASSPDIALAEKLILEGNALEDTGQPGQACELYRQAVAVAPLLAKAYLNLGIGLAASGDNAGAANAYEEVLRINPKHAFGNYNFARLTYIGRDLAKTETMLQQALVTKPDFFEALALLSSVLEESGRGGPAAEAMASALRLRPDDSGAWVNQAMLLQKLDRLDEAEIAARRALEIEPLKTEALWVLSGILRALGFDEDALSALQAAIRNDPGRLDLQAAELFLLNFNEKISATEIFQRHAAFGARMEKALPVRFERRLTTANPDRRLRIGYVSGDFNIHPVSQFMLPVLEAHDRKSFEVFCYSCGTRQDVITEKIRGLCQGWMDASSLSDAKLAETIYSDEIDILVDLSGHSGNVRLAVFSERPATLQASWLGYLNTTGLNQMDYRICDERTDPAELSGPLHTEKLVYLSDSMWCYRPLMEIGQASTAPLQRNGHITFGSFNSGLKISIAMCRRWAEILDAVVNSRLVIADVKSAKKRQAIQDEMKLLGISADRISFMPRMTLPNYFDLYNNVDISLDTYPYGGGTTTFDSLWMGVPVLAASGDTPVSRSAASILAALGLNDWIAPSINDYARLAIQRASDTHEIQRLRQALRPQLMDSPLADESRFVRGLEACYRSMWMDFCRNAASL